MKRRHRHFLILSNNFHNLIPHKDQEVAAETVIRNRGKTSEAKKNRADVNAQDLEIGESAFTVAGS